MTFAKYASNGPGPHTYDEVNYCIRCNLRMEKNVNFCPDCNYRVRYRPRSSKARRRLELAGRIKRY